MGLKLKMTFIVSFGEVYVWVVGLSSATDFRSLLSECQLVGVSGSEEARPCFCGCFINRSTAPSQQAFIAHFHSDGSIVMFYFCASVDAALGAPTIN